MLQLEVAPSPYVQQQSWYSEAYPTSYEPRPERSSSARGMPLRMITTHINQALFPSTLLAHPAKDRRKRLIKFLTVSSTMLVTFITLRDLYLHAHRSSKSKYYPRSNMGRAGVIDVYFLHADPIFPLSYSHYQY